MGVRESHTMKTLHFETDCLIEAVGREGDDPGRQDLMLEQIVGRLSLESLVTGPSRETR